MTDRALYLHLIYFVLQMEEWLSRTSSWLVLFCWCNLCQEVAGVEWRWDCRRIFVLIGYHSNAVFLDQMAFAAGAAHSGHLKVSEVAACCRRGLWSVEAKPSFCMWHQWWIILGFVMRRSCSVAGAVAVFWEASSVGSAQVAATFPLAIVSWILELKLSLIFWSAVPSSSATSFFKCLMIHPQA